MAEPYFINHDDFTNLALPVYGEDWDGVINYFKTAPHEWRRIEELMAEIKEHGQLKAGVIEWDEEDEVYILCNGTHRWAATFLLGTPYLVRVAGESTYDPDEAYTMTDLVIDYSRVDEAHLEKLIDCSCSSGSFRLTDEFWVEGVGFSSRGTGMGVQLEIAFDEIPWELAPLLAEKFLERIDCCIDRSAIEYLDVRLSLHLTEKYWKKD